MYILLCGYPPFNGNDDDEINEAVKEAKFEFYGRILKINPKRKIGARSAREPKI